MLIGRIVFGIQFGTEYETKFGIYFTSILKKIN
jgi:hypothetical protein